MIILLNTNKTTKKFDINALKEYFDTNSAENELVEKTYDGITYKYIVFKFPVARTNEEIKIYDDDDIDCIINSNILKYRGISNYEAIWSKDLNCIECEIQNPNSLFPNRILMNRLSRFLEVIDEYVDKTLGKTPTELMLFSNDNIKVSIGYSSKEFMLLSTYKDGRRIDLSSEITRHRTTLKIEQIKVNTEDDARRALEKISNSLLYQIDLFHNFTLTLTPRRISRDERMKRIRKNDTIGLESPQIKLNYEYDNVPMSLYWFAQSNTTSPIFMYFALYQVLEYYFPIYSTINVKSKIQNIIKDPKFNVNTDTDIMRLLNTVKFNHSGSFGDEREQLDTTLRHITSGEDIIQFINEHEHLKEYYTNRDSLKLADKKLKLTDEIGIIKDLAERIYDIRCRIVHNKASETNKKILPITKEADYLINDVEVLKFVARKAIIANSKPFTIINI